MNPHASRFAGSLAPKGGQGLEGRALVRGVVGLQLAEGPPLLPPALALDPPLRGLLSPLDVVWIIPTSLSGRDAGLLGTAAVLPAGAPRLEALGRAWSGGAAACIRQRRLPLIAGAIQGRPWRVGAPQRGAEVDGFEVAEARLRAPRRP